MPCSGAIPLEQRFPRLWEKARKIIAEQMIRSGWNKHARKFNEVNMRKARKLLPSLV